MTKFIEEYRGAILLFITLIIMSLAINYNVKKINECEQSNNNYIVEKR